MARSAPRAYDPNPVLAAIYDKAFQTVRLQPGWADDLKRMAEVADIVYVLRSLNFVDFLALDHVTKRHGLPPIGFVNDLRLGIFNPLSGGAISALLDPKRTRGPTALGQALVEGGSAVLFLKRPPSVIDLAAGASGERGLTEGDPLLLALLELQRQRERPIYLLPQVFVWARGPDTLGRNAITALFGSRHWPSSARTLGQLLFNFGNVTLRTGEPVNLRDTILGHERLSDAALVRRVTYTILRRLERERSAVIGPAAKAADRVRSEIVRSPKLRHTIEDLAGNKPQERAALTARALEQLKELQACPEPSTMRGLEVVLERLFHRLYAGVEYERADLERVRTAARRGALVLLPSHKSHIDYLILSYIFNAEDLPVPLVAAGENLNFFPAGPILRRAGAFFIRRSFKGDRLYAAVVDAYVRRVMRDGYPIELFLEGGRSRTGKLLPPKFGLLNMIVDQALLLDGHEIFFLPVSIGYERIIEAESFERELSGGEKRREDARGLLISSQVLRHRYGRINLQFGQILSLAEVRTELGLPPESLPTPPKRRALVTRLANRVMDEINRVTAVTPGALTALGLLSIEERSIPHDELVAFSARMLDDLKSQGARITNTLATPDGALRAEAIREAIGMFVEAEAIGIHAPNQQEGIFLSRKRFASLPSSEVAYTLLENKRLALDTSKNIIVHFFVERGLVSLALGRDSRRAPREVLKERVRALSRLFKFEFRFRADAPFDSIFGETLSALLQEGILTQSGEELLPGPGKAGLSGERWLDTYASILRNFIEGYRIAAHSLFRLLAGPIEVKDLVKMALADGQRLYLDAEISRREAISKPLIQNALSAFAEQRIIAQADGKWHLAEQFQSEAALALIEEELASAYSSSGAA